MIFIKVFRRLSSTAATSSTNAALVDVHTHLYLPRYMELLRSRASVPRVFFDKATDSDRLVSQRASLLCMPPFARLIYQTCIKWKLILPSEDLERSTAKGRPVGSEYWQQPKVNISWLHANQNAYPFKSQSFNTSQCQAKHSFMSAHGIKIVRLVYRPYIKN